MRFKILALAAYIASAPTLADVSGEITLVSDYMDYGISNSDHQPVVQIGTAYEHDSGVYTGLWTTPVDDGFGQGYVLDLELGYGRDVADVGLSAGVLRHLFMGDKVLKEGEFNEFYTALAWHNSLITLLFSNDANGTGARQITTELVHAMLLGDGLFNIMLVDIRSLDEDRLLMDDNGDYQFMQLSLGREYKRWYGEVALHMNNLNTEDNPLLKRIAGTRLTASLSWMF